MTDERDTPNDEPVDETVDPAEGADATSDDGAASSGADPFAHEFFDDVRQAAGTPVPEDWVDPELEKLKPRNPIFAQPIVLIVVTLLAGWLATQYVTELQYFLSPSEALDLGRAEEIRLDDDLMQDGRLVLPSNRFVHIEGLIEGRSGAREKTFYKLIGAHIFVEAENVDDRPRILRNVPEMPDRATQSLQDLHDGSGRLLAFEDLPSRYHTVVTYYSNFSRTWFCGFDPSPELQAYHNNLRGRVELEFMDENGRRPTDEELAERVGDRTDCQNAYLLLADTAPKSYWYYPALYLALLSIVVGGVFFLVKTWRTGDESASS